MENMETEKIPHNPGYYFTPQQIGRYTGLCSSQTILRLIHAGKLPARQMPNGGYRIAGSDLWAFLYGGPPPAGTRVKDLRYYKPQGAAWLTGLSRATILRLIHTGKLPARQMPAGKYRIARRDLLALVYGGPPPARISEAEGFPDDDLSYSIQEVADFLEVPIAKVYSLLKDGQLKGTHVTRYYWLIPKAEYEALKARPDLDALLLDARRKLLDARRKTEQIEQFARLELMMFRWSRDLFLLAEQFPEVNPLAKWRDLMESHFIDRAQILASGRAMDPGACQNLIAKLSDVLKSGQDLLQALDQSHPLRQDFAKWIDTLKRVQDQLQALAPHSASP